MSITAAKRALAAHLLNRETTPNGAIPKNELFKDLQAEGHKKSDLEAAVFEMRKDGLIGLDEKIERSDPSKDSVVAQMPDDVFLTPLPRGEPIKHSNWILWPLRALADWWITQRTNCETNTGPPNEPRDAAADQNEGTKEQEKPDINTYLREKAELVEAWNDLRRSSGWGKGDALCEAENAKCTNAESEHNQRLHELRQRHFPDSFARWEMRNELDLPEITTPGGLWVKIEEDLLEGYAIAADLSRNSGGLQVQINEDLETVCRVMLHRLHIPWEMPNQPLTTEAAFDELKRIAIRLREEDHKAVSPRTPKIDPKCDSSRCPGCGWTVPEEFRFLPEVPCQNCDRWILKTGVLTVPVAGEVGDPPLYVGTHSPYWQRILPSSRAHDKAHDDSRGGRSKGQQTRTRGRRSGKKPLAQDSVKFQIYKRIQAGHVPSADHLDLVDRLKTDKDFVQQVKDAELTLDTKLVRKALAFFDLRRRREASNKQQTDPA